MRAKSKPDLARRSLLKAGAIVAGAIAGYGRPVAAQVAEGRPYYGDTPPAWEFGGPPPDLGGDNPRWAAGPGCTPISNRMFWPWRRCWPWANGAGCNPNNYCLGAVCFLRGTRILAEHGYRPIESLAVGQRVVARFAGLAAIERIESFTLLRSGPRREWLGHSRPVTIRRDALGEGSPHADLCLTASHAVFVDGFLMPVGQLVNGTSIVFETAEGRDTLDFFHIELERHDVLDAEGAPCESLYHAPAETCVPMLSFGGGRGALRSRLRSAAALVVDRRQPIDLIRDGLEERGLALAGV